MSGPSARALGEYLHAKEGYRKEKQDAGDVTGGYIAHGIEMVCSALFPSPKHSPHKLNIFSWVHTQLLILPTIRP